MLQRRSAAQQRNGNLDSRPVAVLQKCGKVSCVTVNYIYFKQIYTHHLCKSNKHTLSVKSKFISLMVKMLQSIIGMLQSVASMLQSMLGMLQSMLETLQSAWGMLQSMLETLQSAWSMLQSMLETLKTTKCLKHAAKHGKHGRHAAKQGSTEVFTGMVWMLQDKHCLPLQSVLIQS